MKECPTVFSQREFILCRIIVFALTFEDLAEQRNVAGSISNRARLLDPRYRFDLALDMDGRVNLLEPGRRNECMAGRNRGARTVRNLKP